jgi:hypothetical protein
MTPQQHTMMLTMMLTMIFTHCCFNTRYIVCIAQVLQLWFTFLAVLRGPSLTSAVNVPACIMPLACIHSPEGQGL